MAAPDIPPPHVCGIALVNASDEGRRVTYDDLQPALRSIRRSPARIALPLIELALPHLKEMPITEEMGPAFASIKPPLLNCIQNSILYAGLQYTSVMSMFDRALILAHLPSADSIDAPGLVRWMHDQAQESYCKAQQHAPGRIAPWPLAAPITGQAETAVQLLERIIALAKLHPFIQLAGHNKKGG